MLLDMILKQEFLLAQGLISAKPSLQNKFTSDIFAKVFPPNAHKLWNRYHLLPPSLPHPLPPSFPSLTYIPLFRKLFNQADCPPVKFLSFLFKQTLIRPDEKCLEPFLNRQKGSSSSHIHLLLLLLFFFFFCCFFLSLFQLFSFSSVFR